MTKSDLSDAVLARLATPVEQLAKLSDFNLLLLKATLSMHIEDADRKNWRHDFVTEGAMSYGRETCINQASHDAIMAPYKAFLERADHSREIRKASATPSPTVKTAPPNADIETW